MPTVSKDYLHQFLLQAQGWEFFYYSIAFVYQYLHRLGWNLFKEKEKLSIGIQINPMKVECRSLFLPSSCNNMFVFRRFLARATSLSVTLVQSRILKPLGKIKMSTSLKRLCAFWVNNSKIWHCCLWTAQHTRDYDFNLMKSWNFNDPSSYTKAKMLLIPCFPGIVNFSKIVWLQIEIQSNMKAG